MNYLNVLAKALYDNVAESPDELSFRKGDIMTVLERNTQGLEGWWLCSLHGRQGIVPGNRLKILVGMYDKKQGGAGGDQSQQKPQQQTQQAPQTPLPYNQGVYNVLSTSNQYTAMHPAYQGQGGENVYLVPAPPKGQQGLYQTPQASPHPGQTAPSKQPNQYQTPPAQHAFPSQVQDIYQVPPSMNQPQELYQIPVGSTSPPQPQDVYQVPPSVGTGQDIYQVPPSMTPSQEIYQVPPSMDMRGCETRKLPGKVVLPTRVGQVYVYDSHKTEQQDEYDVPRNQVPAGSQEIYDVPTRCLVNTYSPEVYDIPPMAVKGPVSRQHTQEIYDIPPSLEKTLTDQLNTHLTIYDIPPSVTKDVVDCPKREETYDFPPAFSNLKMQVPTQVPVHVVHDPDPYIPEDIYDIPPPAVKGGDMSYSQEIYDVPPSLRKQSGQTFLQDVYDVPREFHGGKTSLENEADYIYDVPPQVDREVKSVDEPVGNFKRLSVSSTGSTRSNISNSSLDTIPVKESSVVPPKPGKELNLDLEAAMELLVKLQHGVNSSILYLMSFISSTWRNPEQMETNVQNIQAAVEGVKIAVKELLEFARGAVGNSAQASDRSLHAKLSKQLQKMEEIYQQLLKHSQALDSCNWALNILVTPKSGSSDDLDRFIMYSRGIPDDTKQLASFLHGNASLLFKRTKQHLSLGDSQTGQDNTSNLANNNNNQSGHTEKASIQSRPLPSPPKFIAEESPDGQYENNESGWMEDYDYVHLQGKEEFEKTQKELLEKGNIIRQGKGHLEQQQLKQFERLEEEVARPIDSDLSNWTPPQHYGQVRSVLSSSDRQLLLFYQEQCEANVTTLTNAIDAFYSSISSNQPPKIFVAHSKFVILSAHKLVFIGDTLSRQAKAQDIRNKVTHYSNLLCDKLKEIVLTTKTAALQYPSPSAAKDMVDRVKDLSNSTQQFRMVLGQLATM